MTTILNQALINEVSNDVKNGGMFDLNKEKQLLALLKERQELIELTAEHQHKECIREWRGEIERERFAMGDRY